MNEFLNYVGLVWAIWIGVNVGMFLFSAAFYRPQNTAHFNGFRIIFPYALRERLSYDEEVAVYEHEEAHRDLGHIWINLARVCVFNPSTPQELLDQELEADDSVKDRIAMASAIRRLSSHPQDMYRAERLERCWKGSQEAGNLTSGMDEQLRKGQFK